jgi:hypothetical protein
MASVTDNKITTYKVQVKLAFPVMWYFQLSHSYEWLFLFLSIFFSLLNNLLQSIFIKTFQRFYPTVYFKHYFAEFCITVATFASRIYIYWNNPYAYFNEIRANWGCLIFSAGAFLFQFNQ